MFGVDDSTRKQLAEKFFGQRHSNIIVVKAVLNVTTWIVTVSTGMPSVVRQVSMDAINGKILGFERIDFLYVLSQRLSPEIKHFKFRISNQTGFTDEELKFVLF